MPSRRWNNVTKTIVIITLGILAILAVVTFREMIAPTIVAFLLAFVLSYPVNWIQRQTGWARGVAVALLYIVLALFLLLVPVLIAPRLAVLFASLQTTLADLLHQIQTIDIIFASRTFSAESLLQPLRDSLQNVLSGATPNPLSIFRGVTVGMLNFMYVVVLNFWLLKDQQRWQRLLLEQVPNDYQEDVRRLAMELAQIWEGFLRGQIALAFVIGVLTWVPLAILGMPNAGGLALLAGVMEFLPSVGPGISGAIGTAVALFQGPTWMQVSHLTFAIIVAVIYSIIAQLENVYLLPRLVGGRVKLHPAVAFVAVIAGTLVFGFLGVLLATPVVATVRTLLIYLYRKLLDLEPFELAQTLHTAVRIRGLIAGRKIEAIVFDLEGTLTEVDWAAPEWASSRFTWLNWLLSPGQRAYYIRRFMVRIEGLIGFGVSQLQRLHWDSRLQQLTPFFNFWRGFSPADEIALRPETVSPLHRLGRHYHLGLISARERKTVERFLMQTGMAGKLFDALLTREDVRNLLPHSEGLLKMVEQLNVNPDHLLLVSDTDVNLRAGRAMGMAVAGVLGGLGEEIDLQETDLVLANVAELEDWL